MKVTLLVAAFAAFLASGCGGPKVEPTYEVRGTVSVDGEPLDVGDVYFVNEGAAPSVFTVVNGAFSGQATAGEHVVQIYAYKIVPPPPTATGDVEEMKENYLPAEYNSESNLKATVESGGGGEFSFEVSSTGG